MNRKIKFRAWDDKNKEWLLGYDLENLGGFSLFGECVLMGEWEKVAYPFIMQLDGKEFDDLKVMQFIGIKDLNDKEIYTGDIIKWGHHCGACQEPTPRIAEVKLNPDIQFHAYNIGHTFEYGRFAYTQAHLEVIGNIYENPELLEDK